ncbi:MAG: peptidoglycan -binding protein [Lysobacterales bacterium]
MSSRASRHRPLDIWPGFVDALAALLMVVIFVLLLFTLGQYFLTDELSGKQRALGLLEGQVAELSELLGLEKTTTAELQQRLATLSSTLASAREDSAGLQTTLTETRASLTASTDAVATLNADLAALTELRDSLQKEVADLAGALDTSRRETTVQMEMSDAAQAQVVMLNRQIQALRQQLTEISGALELAQQANMTQNEEIEDLGRRLNLALATQVKKLENYRSDFFGRLKTALGDNPDLRVEGDRFVFQSELLFASGLATLEDQGKAQVRRLASVLKDIEGQIPDDIDWVLRIDGHTDTRPISSNAFPSNWELSTARALAIVRYLENVGINPRRLAATGFAEYHPIDARDNELAFARNRRIELKLTAR